MALLTDEECKDIIGASSVSPLITLVRRGTEAAIEQILGYRIESRVHTEFYPDSDVANRGRNEFVDVQSGRAIFFSERPSVGRILQLRNIPVRRDGIEVREHIGARAGLGTDPWPTSSILTLGVDYYIDFDQDNLCRSGQLIRNAGAWPAEPRSIKVTYKSGYTASELSDSDADVRVADIKFWALIAVQSIYAQVKQSQVKDGSLAAKDKTSESIGNYSYSIGSGPQQSFAGMIPPAVRQGLQPHVSYRRVGGSW